MKKLLTIALAVICMAVLTGLAVGQGAQEKDKKRQDSKPAATKPSATTDKSGIVIKGLSCSPCEGKVTKVSREAFSIVTKEGNEVTFSRKLLTSGNDLLQVGRIIDVTCTDPPKPGDPPAATTIKGSKMNSSDRVMRPDFGSKPAAEQVMTGEVIRLNKEANTFTIMTKGDKGNVEVTFSRAKRIAYGEDSRSDLLQVGSSVEVTYIQPTPGGQLEARAVRKPKPHTVSNVFYADRVPRTENQMVTGTVTEVNAQAQTFTLRTANGEQFTFSFSAKEMRPKKDDQVAVSYIQKTPGNLDDRRIPVNTPERISLIQGLDNPQAVSITIYFGKARCAPGFGICRIDIGSAGEGLHEVALRGPDTSTRARPRTGQASVSVEQDKTAKGENVRVRYFYGQIMMKTALPEKGSVIPVAENITLDAATAKALGFKSVTVLRGEYKIDYSKNKLGSVVVNVEVHN